LYRSLWFSNGLCHKFSSLTSNTVSFEDEKKRMYKFIFINILFPSLSLSLTLLPQFYNWINELSFAYISIKSFFYFCIILSGPFLPLYWRCVALSHKQILIFHISRDRLLLASTPFVSNYRWNLFQNLLAFKRGLVGIKQT
jgi:hypothetical protein